MTARAFATDVVDPSGLNGEFVKRYEVNAPDIIEVWVYPASMDFDEIKRAWKAAPQPPRTLVLSVVTLKQSAGRLFVSVRLYVEPQTPPLHIDEPLDV